VALESLWVNLPTILASVSIVGEVAVLGLLLRRKAWSNLPIFVAYIAWTLLSDLISFYLQHIRVVPGDVYFRFYVVETAIDSVFLFTVLVELGWSVLRPVRASLPRSSLYILAFLIAVAGMIVWPLVSKVVPATLGPDSVILFHLTETSAILRVGCFLVLASFSQLLSIGWRDRELQIATGFGFYSIISLIVAVLHSHAMSVEQYYRLDMVGVVGYYGTLAYWVLSFSTKEQERKDFTPQMRQLLLSMSGGGRASRIAHTDLPSERSRKKD